MIHLDDKISLRKSFLTCSIVAAVAAPIGYAVALRKDVDGLERRMFQFEETVKWQSEVLWEIRGDIKVMKAAAQD